ncbi:MAG: endopeptidase La [Polyangiaceae bacterium]|nr:endopeptidase La [Polyangiaceae bacterium]
MSLSSDPQNPGAIALPLLPLRNGVLLPGSSTTLTVGRERSLTLARALEPGAAVLVAVQRDAKVDEPGLADLFEVATYARVRSVVSSRNDRYQLTVEGLGRMHLDALAETEPFWRAVAHPADESGGSLVEAHALAESLVDRLKALSLSAELADKLARAEEPGRTADLCAAALGLRADREAEVLVALEVPARLRLVHTFLSEAEEAANVRRKVDHEVQQELRKGQREHVLRQQLKAIKKELGEDKDGEGELAELKRKLAEAELPEEAAKVAARELERLEEMGPNQAEHHVIRKYLELIAELPWNKRAAVKEDLDAVAQKLEADHDGLDEVKKRVLEHLAVRKMTGHNRGAILCLVGPPGVGKTSLGQSVADASGRPLVRVSLGGVRDEAEIRGHRRTYVGALPGRILHALKRAKVKNPILLLDEVDKLGVGWMGSPEAALLEVLDPEQNSTFTDHYLELAFDLSEVLFVCTANSLEPLSAPLRDRLEIIELQGYTVDEKVGIARRHLLPKKLAEHGLPDTALAVSDAALAAIVVDYTREAGVRQLQRELTKICRSVALEHARRPDQKPEPAKLEPEALGRYLGKAKFWNEVAERTSIPGVATGLAWTPVGGDILFVECSRMPGSGRLEITGQLGDVMKESARAALTFVRSHASELDIDGRFFESLDLHVHVPAGAVPKDGPSAGVTIFTALASLLSNRRTRADTAMTGECTLRGRVLPVGGIKSKLLAAHRAGIRRVILPEKNRRDVEEVPERVRATLELIFAEDMSQVLREALEPLGTEPATPTPGAGSGEDTSSKELPLA